MGADFILTTALVSDASVDILKGRVDRITVDDLNAIAVDLYPFAEDDEADVPEYVRNEIRIAIDEVVGQDRHDLQEITVGDAGVYIAGGMSWGDEPSDAWPLVSVLAWSEVTDDSKWVD